MIGQYLSTKGKHMLRGVCAVALMLSACSGSEQEQAEAPPQVPVAVQEMMAADFPADGEIHVQSRGTFEITPATMLCRAHRDVDPALEDSVPHLLGPGLGVSGAAASSGLSGRLGEDVGNGSICNLSKANVITTWALSPNRDGTLYRIVAAVWQDDPSRGGAVWIGGLERLGELPDLPPPIDDMPSGEVTASQQEIEAAEFRAKVRWNIAKDVRRLSGQFSEIFSGTEQ